MYDACVPWPERPKGAKDKSRGPKGLELEVGARRAPKLLVCYICMLCIFVVPKILLYPLYILLYALYICRTKNPVICSVYSAICSVYICH